MGTKKPAKSSKPLRKKAMKATKGGISGRVSGLAVDPSDPSAGITDGTSNTILLGEKVFKP